MNNATAYSSEVMEGASCGAEHRCCVLRLSQWVWKRASSRGGMAKQTMPFIHSPVLLLLLLSIHPLSPQTSLSSAPPPHFLTPLLQFMHTHTQRGGVGWNDNTLAPHPTSCLPDANTHTLAQPHGCIYSYRQKRKITTRDTAPNPQYTQPLEPLLHIPQNTHTKHPNLASWSKHACLLSLSLSPLPLYHSLSPPFTISVRLFLPGRHPAVIHTQLLPHRHQPITKRRHWAPTYQH